MLTDSGGLDQKDARDMSTRNALILLIIALLLAELLLYILHKWNANTSLSPSEARMIAAMLISTSKSTLNLMGLIALLEEGYF